MKYKLLLSVLFTLVLTNLNAQSNSKQFRKKFEEADAFLSAENTSKALAIFNEIYPKDSLNSNLNYKIALCYLKSKQEKNKAIPYLEKANQNLTANYIEFEPTETNAPYKALYLLASSYHYNYQFAQAITAYTNYLNYLTENKSDKKEIKIIEQEIERCKFGLEAIKNPTRIKVENLGEKINSIYPDYAPLISADETVLIFTTRRKSLFNGNDDADGRGKFNDDIYISYKEDNEWQEAKPLNNFINTKENDATVGLSADGQQLFLYKEGDIYLSKLDGDNWGQAIKLNNNINTKAFEPSAAISSDGNTLYFVSDRKGGFGGRDIYKSKKLPNGDWGAAQNLGSNINTEFDEDGPFISFDSKSLYFSSTGHNSMGGYDLFVSKLDDNGEFQKPENLGYPVNTTGDDVFFVTTPDEKHGYYSSEKEGGIGETDIYKLTFEEKVETEVTVLAGKIINKDGGSISSSVEIIVSDISGKQETQYYRPNIKTGKYIFSLIAGSTYQISYLVDGSEFNKEVLDVPEGTGYQIINREVLLKAVAYGNEHLQKAKNNKETTNSVDTASASIKVSGMSNTAIAMVNNAKSNNTENTNSLETNANSLSNASHKEAANNSTNSDLSNSSTNNATTANTSLNTPKTNTDSANNNNNNNNNNAKETNKNTNTTASNNSASTALTQSSNSLTNTNTKNSTQQTKIKAIHFLFAFNQSTLSQAALNDLKKLAKIMRQNPNLTIQIEGHTDSVGNDNYNQALSERRAKSVKNYLVSLGVTSTRIKPIGAGENKPIAINLNADGTLSKKGMTFNRRIDLYLSENQDDFIEPLTIPDELKIKTGENKIENKEENKTYDSVKTKF